jgi:hypothetical protein
MYHYNEEKSLPKSMSIVTRFGFLASLSINKSKSTWHILHIFACHYMHAYFPRLNTPRALFFVLLGDRMEEVVIYLNRRVCTALCPTMFQP